MNRLLQYIKQNLLRKLRVHGKFELGKYSIRAITTLEFVPATYYETTANEELESECSFAMITLPYWTFTFQNQMFSKERAYFITNVT